MNKYNKSTKRFLRKEKARIRREVLDLNKQDELIKGLYLKLNPEKTEQKAEKEKEKKKVVKKDKKQEKSVKEEKPKKQEKKPGKNEKDKKDEDK